MTRTFRIIATETREWTREADTSDEWDRGDDVVSVEFHCAVICDPDTPGGMDAHHVCDKGGYGDKVHFPWDHDEDHVALVVARYETGDTFGRTTGNWEVEAAFAELDEAKKWAKANDEVLNKKHDDYFGGLERVEVFWIPFNNLSLVEPRKRPRLMSARTARARDAAPSAGTAYFTTEYPHKKKGS